MADTEYPQPVLNAPTVATPASTTSLEVGSRTWVLGIFAISLIAGLFIAMAWSFQVADGVLGQNIANTALGQSAIDMRIDASGQWFGIVFAFVAGLATTFTACNCVVFSCIAPLAAAKGQQRRSLWRIIGWMALGIVLVTGAYGAAGAVFGHSIPALSDAKLDIGTGYPIRLAQSTIVFSVLGLVLLIWGAHTLGIVPNPLGRLSAGQPWLKPFGLGLMIGFFSVGRPFALFHKAFEYAAYTGNPILSAGAMALQGLGNIVFMILLLLLLMYGTGGRFERWMFKYPGRVALVTAISMIIGGAFFLGYWGLRVPSYFGIGWFPHMPYN
jgi:cytochrome c biogenesis protein CcdA